MKDQEFAVLFERYMSSKRDDMRKKYDRVLPSGELIFNRFDKGAYLNCGAGSSVYDTSVVLGNVCIGDHVWVGPYTLLDGSAAPLVIGDYVSINTGAMVYTHDSTKNYVSGGVDPFVKGGVTIGHNTVIGAMAMIACNVSIGHHCVVAAHSYVNHDVPDCSIVAGAPAKVIGTVVQNEDGTVCFHYHQKDS